ncbi:MAG: START domain-containing protein, partial [Myxococcota bacterium]
FVHALFRRPLDDRSWVVGYLSVDDPELPPPLEGFVRCPIYPSGQRVTQLEHGRIRVEHLMVYDLGGAISVRTQNLFFRRGHVAAYHREWRSLGARLLEFRRGRSAAEKAA